AGLHRLDPPRLPLSGHPVPGELLRPPRHRPARLHGRAGRHERRRAAGSALAGALALLRPPPRGRAPDGGGRPARAARGMAASPGRVALIASSSWSHAFLTPKNYLLHPDIPADRPLYEALRTGD